MSKILLPHVVPALRKTYPHLTLIRIEDKTDALLRALNRGDLVAGLLPMIAVPTETHRSQLSIRTLERPVPFRTIVLGWRRRSAMAETLRKVADPSGDGGEGSGDPRGSGRPPVKGVEKPTARQGLRQGLTSEVSPLVEPDAATSPSTGALQCFAEVST